MGYTGENMNSSDWIYTYTNVLTLADVADTRLFRRGMLFPNTRWLLLASADWLSAVLRRGGLGKHNSARMRDSVPPIQPNRIHLRAQPCVTGRQTITVEKAYIWLWPTIFACCWILNFIDQSRFDSPPSTGQSHRPKLLPLVKVKTYKSILALGEES